MSQPFATVPEAFAELAAGRMIILIDDEDRENEGDLVVAAEHITPAAITFMAKEASGLVCLALAGEICDRLGLPPQALDNRSKYGTNFTVSIEAAQGVTTGISSADRAHTIRTAVDPDVDPAALVRPGHVFPIRARDGGVLVRAGQTEGSVDLCRLGGLRPAAVICEIMNEDGTMARLPELQRFAATHGIKIATVASIIEYRRRFDRLVERVESVSLPNERGDWLFHLFIAKIDGREHTALTLGMPVPPPGERAAPLDEPIMVRVHSCCLTGDVFGSQRCDCGAQLAAAQEAIARAGRGALIYLNQEGRGIGLRNKLHAYRLQDQGLDTVEANLQLGFKADQREYGIGAQILLELGVRRLRLLTNNPSKYISLQGYGLEIVERIGLVVPATRANRGYLDTKRRRLGHDLPDLDLSAADLPPPLGR